LLLATCEGYRTRTARPYGKHEINGELPSVLATMKRIALLFGLLLLTTVSCFERAVDERLGVEIVQDGNVVVKNVVTLNEKGDEKKKVKARLDRLRDSLINERDDWSRRYALVEWEEDRVERARVEGQLYRVTRTGTTSREQLHRFFSDFAVTNFTRGEGWDELTITPLAPGRATAKQRQLVEEKLESSSAAVAAYLRDVDTYYDYLRLHPDRAHDTFALLLRDVISGEPEVAEISEEEEKMIDRINDHFQQLSSMLDPEDDAEYSLDELSLLVYDPFPADVTMTLPGRVLSAEGFEKESEKVVTLRRAGLWESTATLQSGWLSPDPLMIWVDAWQDENKKKVDLDEVVATSRRIETKSAAEVRAAIVAALKPRPRYTVRWE
jgi:hypothetical protein